MFLITRPDRDFGFRLVGLSRTRSKAIAFINGELFLPKGKAAKVKDVVDDLGELVYTSFTYKGFELRLTDVGKAND